MLAIPAAAPVSPTLTAGSGSGNGDQFGRQMFHAHAIHKHLFSSRSRRKFSSLRRNPFSEQGMTVPPRAFNSLVNCSGSFR